MYPVSGRIFRFRLGPILRSIEMMCMDSYVSMLWELGSDRAEQFFKSWNTCGKLVYNVPLSTYTYLVEKMTTLHGFFRKLLPFPSREVRGPARIVSNDPRSSTCRNLRFLTKKTGLRKPHEFTSFRLKECLLIQNVSDIEQWRLGLLNSLFQLRSERLQDVMDMKTVSAMITSLCST